MRKTFTTILLLAFGLGIFATGFENEVLEKSVVKEFTIYPNPTNGDLYIQLESLYEDQNLSLKIYSLIGQEVYRQNIPPFSGNMKLQLDLNKYPKGIYMIEISDGKDTRTKRISLI